MTKRNSIGKDQHTPPDGAVSSAAYGLQCAAEKQGPLLHSYDVNALASTALRHAHTTSLVWWRDDVAAERERAQRRIGQVLRRACAAESARDRALVAVQRVLTELAGTDRELAERLAYEAGVMLHLEP